MPRKVSAARKRQISANKSRLTRLRKKRTRSQTEKCSDEGHLTRTGRSKRIRSKARGKLAGASCRLVEKKKGNRRYKAVRKRGKDGVMRTYYVLRTKKKK